MSEREFTYRPFWGMWAISAGRAVWRHNPALNMTADEQYDSNLKAGHFPNGASYPLMEA